MQTKLADYGSGNLVARISLVNISRTPTFYNIQASKDLKKCCLFKFYCTTYKPIYFIWHRIEIMMATADKIYTNVSQTDQEHNGSTLTLKMDQTFHLYNNNSAWDSKFQKMWNWSSSFTIEGVWSYDHELKTITLTATKFRASLDEPIHNQEQVISKGFPNRVVVTPNFNIQQSKEIKAFDVDWDYSNFKRVVQGTLKRK